MKPGSVEDVFEESGKKKQKNKDSDMETTNTAFML